MEYEDNWRPSEVLPFEKCRLVCDFSNINLRSFHKHVVYEEFISFLNKHNEWFCSWWARRKSHRRWVRLWRPWSRARKLPRMQRAARDGDSSLSLKSRFILFLFKYYKFYSQFPLTIWKMKEHYNNIWNSKEKCFWVIFSFCIPDCI